MLNNKEYNSQYHHPHNSQLHSLLYINFPLLLHNEEFLLDKFPYTSFSTEILNRSLIYTRGCRCRNKSRLLCKSNSRYWKSLHMFCRWNGRGNSKISYRLQSLWGHQLNSSHLHIILYIFYCSKYLRNDKFLKDRCYNRSSRRCKVQKYIQLSTRFFKSDKGILKYRRSNLSNLAQCKFNN